MRRTCLAAWSAALAAGLAAYAASGPAAAQAPAEVSAQRAQFMRQHFASVLAAHDAVIRGDLDEARRHARAIADQPAPPALPPAAAPYFQSMQVSAARAAAGTALEDIAASTAAMLGMCGDCHRAVGTMPALAAPARPAVGGQVGHMLDHKAAVDLMVEGLTVPSTTAWNEGAAALRGAPLRRGDLPPDRGLTRDIVALEARLHELAERGEAAGDVRARVFVYSEVLQSCSPCHALHPNVWGPDKR